LTASGGGQYEAGRYIRVGHLTVPLDASSGARVPFRYINAETLTREGATMRPAASARKWPECYSSTRWETVITQRRRGRLPSGAVAPTMPGRGFESQPCDGANGQLTASWPLSSKAMRQATDQHAAARLAISNHKMRKCGILQGAVSGAALVPSMARHGHARPRRRRRDQ
jgi:hypothetical protein